MGEYFFINDNMTFYDGHRQQFTVKDKQQKTIR